MKKYTQADFDNFEVDEFGWKRCPSGDYTAISSFGDSCIFGAGSSFGAGSRFGADWAMAEQWKGVESDG